MLAVLALLGVVWLVLGFGDTVTTTATISLTTTSNTETITLLDENAIKEVDKRRHNPNSKLSHNWLRQLTRSPITYSKLSQNQLHDGSQPLVLGTNSEWPHNVSNYKSRAEVTRSPSTYSELSQNLSYNGSSPHQTHSTTAYSVRRKYFLPGHTDHFYYTKGNTSLPKQILITNARRFVLSEESESGTSQQSDPKNANKLSAGNRIHKMISNGSVKSHKKSKRKGKERRALHSADNRDPDYKLFGLPKEEQLDMAPAKGGRIHSMRQAGRLCQRSVLFPEGPKYDARGRTYLPAYTPFRGHEFPDTRPPDLLLPRCCNCCKKSVLGCE